MAPVEYAVAVDEYLGQAALGEASRRVYRISLTGWAWPLVGKPIPGAAERRGAVPPVVPLALLDDPATGGRLRGALAERAGRTDARTVNRELSALRSAVGWWLDRGWVAADPTAGLRHRQPDGLAAPLAAAQVDALLRLPVSLREHAFWRLLHDSGRGRRPGARARRRPPGPASGTRPGPGRATGRGQASPGRRRPARSCAGCWPDGPRDRYS